MTRHFYCAFRVKGEFVDCDVRVSATGERVSLHVTSVVQAGLVAGGDGFGFDMRAGDAGTLAMKLLEAMSAVNRDRMARMVRDAIAGRAPEDSL
jgi:hypothetical protein